MTRPPAVSVVVPTYNRSWGLRRAVAGVLGQTFADFEVVVADDASTDDTPEVARSFADPRVRYHRQPANVGVARNWGAGLALARGEFVALLMDDDRYDPPFLAARLAALRASPGAAFAFSGYRSVDEGGRTVGVHAPPLAPGATLAGLELVGAALGHYAFVGSALFRAAALRAVWPAAEPHGLVVDYAAILGLALRPGAAAAFLGTDDFAMAHHHQQLSHTRADEVFAALARLLEGVRRDPAARPARRLVCKNLSDRYVQRGRQNAAEGRRREAAGWQWRAVRLCPLSAGPWKQLARAAAGLRFGADR